MSYLIRLELIHFLSIWLNAGMYRCARYILRNGCLFKVQQHIQNIIQHLVRHCENVAISLQRGHYNDIVKQIQIG